MLGTESLSLTIAPYIHEGAQQPKEQKYLDVKWKEYNVAILSLALKIKQSGWEPDCIVCIGRGGMYLGDALSRIFQKTLGVHMCSSYTGEGEMQQGNLIIAEHLSITLKELRGKVLLADDLVDSGKTLLALKNYMMQQNASITDIKTSVIYRKTCTKFPPDFHGEVVNENIWIFLPNEIFDQMALKNLSKELLQKLSEDQLKELAMRMLDSLPENPLQSIQVDAFNRLALELGKRAIEAAARPRC